MAAPHLRRSVRALVVDADDCLLLGRFTLPHVTLWATPGGGIEAGEDPLTALRRELREEIGLELATDPPHVWTRTVVLAGAVPGHDGQVEDYHWVRVERFEPRGELTDEQLAAENLGPLRWWSVDELRAAGETFAPRDLPERFATLLADGLPTAPTILGL